MSVPALQRFTTQYSESEDRIRLTGEIDAGRQVELWLTLRMLDRLIPALTQWLEKQSSTELRAEVLQSMAQKAARDALDPQAAVQRGNDTPGWLVHAVNLTPLEHGLLLTFRANDETAGVTLTLQGRPLRQWLNIVYDQYCKAGWPVTAWPVWIREIQNAKSSPLPEVVLH